MDRGWMDTVRRLVRQRRVVAGAVVTLITLGLVGVVVVATTSAGCSLVKSLVGRSTQCPTAPLAILTSPTASLASSPSSTPPVSGSPSPNPTPSFGPTVYPPWDPASSPGFAPGPQYYPPLADAASGPNFPGVALPAACPSTRSGLVPGASSSSRVRLSSRILAA